MNNSSLPMIFLLLAIAGLVFGIGVVAISRRKARAVPQIQRIAPVVTAAAAVIEAVGVVEAVAAAPLSVRDRWHKLAVHSAVQSVRCLVAARSTTQPGSSLKKRCCEPTWVCE